MSTQPKQDARLIGGKFRAQLSRPKHALRKAVAAKDFGTIRAIMNDPAKRRIVLGEYETYSLCWSFISRSSHLDALRHLELINSVLSATRRVDSRNNVEDILRQTAIYHLLDRRDQADLEDAEYQRARVQVPNFRPIELLHLLVQLAPSGCRGRDIGRFKYCLGEALFAFATAEDKPSAGLLRNKFAWEPWESSVGNKTCADETYAVESIIKEKDQEALKIALNVVGWDGPEWVDMDRFFDAAVENSFVEEVATIFQGLNVPDVELLRLAATRGQVALMQRLADGAMNVNRLNKLGETALISVITSDINDFQRKEEIVQHLVRLGADVNMPGADNEMPLRKAIDLPKFGVLRILLNGGARPDRKILEVSMGRDEIWAKAAAEEHSPGEQLLSRCSDDVVTEYSADPILHLAVNHRNPELVRAFLGRGVDVNVKGTSNTTALHEAGKLSKNGPEILQILLDSGAEIDSRDEYGRTPLYDAINESESSAQILRTLLLRGATVNTPTEMGNTPLHRAAYISMNNLEVLQLLLDAGANINAQNHLSDTPLCGAVAKGNQAMVRVLLDRGADLNIAGEDGRTPLIWAAAIDDIVTLGMILDGGANIHARTVFGNTAFHAAAMFGKNRQRKLKLLLDHGAEVNARNKKKETALHLLKERADKEYLIHNKADPDIMNLDGERAGDVWEQPAGKGAKRRIGRLIRRPVRHYLVAEHGNIRKSTDEEDSNWRVEFDTSRDHIERRRRDRGADSYLTVSDLSFG